MRTVKPALCIFLAVTAAALVALTPGDIINMPADTWLAVPNSGFKHLDPCPERTCSYSRVMGIWGIFAWSGGVFNTRRSMFIMWGGGHNDYGGNEIYAFSVNTMAWGRLTDPTLNPTRCSDANWDGTPTSRHTYGAVDYLPDVDQFWNWGGAIDCGAGGCSGNTAWLFDFATNKWIGKKPGGTVPNSMCPGSMASYDPVTKRVWLAKSGLYSYSCPLNSWAKHNNDSYYDIGSAMDTKRGLFILTGNGSVTVYNVRSGSLAKQTWTTTGNTGLISKGKVGLDYDPVADRIVGWHGGSVYALNMDTKVWTAHSGGGAPTPNGTGTYGSWRYVPSVNAFIAVTGVDDNVHFFKLTAGGPVTEENPGLAGPSAFSVTASPNPFQASTVLRVSRTAEPVSIHIYDIHGKIVGAYKNVRSGRVTWNARGLSSGVYMLRAEMNGKRISKVLLVGK